MDTLQTKRYTEGEIDDMIEEYKAKFGGNQEWKHAGQRAKFIAVKGTAVEYNREEGRLYLRGNMDTAVTMKRILQVKREVKEERELVAFTHPKECIYGCCSYASEWNV